MIVELVMWTVLASGRLPGRGGRAVHAALSGLWLGLLSEARLRELDEHYYREDSMYRTTTWNDRGLAWWEGEAISRNFRTGSSIVVLACGGGREVLALLGQGYDATGYEPHRDLRAYGETFLAARGYPGRVRSMPRDRYPDNARCDGVVLGWGAYSLIAGRDQRVSLLRAAGRAVTGGGPVLLSCFVSHGPSRTLRLSSRIAGALRQLRARGPVELGDILAPNRVHVFTRAELAAEIEDAQLILDSYEVVAATDPVTSYACVAAVTPR